MIEKIFTHLLLNISSIPRAVAKSTFGHHCTFSPAFWAVSLLWLSGSVFAQTSGGFLSSRELKKMSIEELMNLEVTSVSKRSEKLTEVASAIQVITQEDIRRSGATSVPEALRLAPNLQVAQVNSSQWAISARGFNNVLANKLLVLVDGRTIYTPLYAGVFWDVQNILLEDVDRIEVISGPGGTLWGSNAVNGVINIITKSSKETPGFFAEAGVGTELRSLLSLRYGGKITDALSYRVYGTAFKRGNTVLNTGAEANDHWTMGKAGFRLDWDATKKDLLTLQADLYGARPQPDGGKPAVASGGNMIARWTRQTSEKSNFQLQAYYDQTGRNFPNGLIENLRTYDLDWQNRHQIGQTHEVVWGLGLRLMDHQVENIASLGYRPEHKLLHIYSAFIQDRIWLVKDKWSLTVGSKLEHNSYTGFQYQPNGRLAWTPTSHQIVWGAVSRAVRTPARTDRELYANAASGAPFITGNSDFLSETLIAYELGWRIQPYEKLSVSLATFYNVYDNIRSAEPGPSPQKTPITFGNGVAGKTYGIELAATHQLFDWWQLRGGYTFLKKNLVVKSTSADLNGGTAESNDPAHQFLIQSSMDLPGRIELGAVIRYVDKLQKPIVASYVGLDVRISWKLSKVIELNIVGQNLADYRHTEFIPSSPSPRKMERSIYGKILCRF